MFFFSSSECSDGPWVSRLFPGAPHYAEARRSNVLNEAATLLAAAALWMSRTLVSAD